MTNKNMLFKSRAEQSRAVWIELLRIVACFSVILLHVATKGWNLAGVDTNVWPIYELFCSISRIGVCCFVMISGALFLGNARGKDIEGIYRKYIFKILTLIIFWSCAYLLFRIINGNLKITGLNNVFGELLFGSYHLWYLWMIAGLYAITPILTKIVEDDILCRYFLILCTVACWIPGMLAVVPKLNELVQGILQDKMYLFLPVGYVGYYVLGYYLYNAKITKKHRMIIIATGILGMVYAVVGGILHSRHIGQPSQATYNNLSLNIALYSAMVFLIFKEKIGSIRFSERAKKYICTIGKSTLGIYLVHVIFVQTFSDRFMIATSYNYPLASIPIAVLIFVLGYLITNIVKEIPFLGKWIV